MKTSFCSWLLAVFSLTSPLLHALAQTPVSSGASPSASSDPIIGSFLIIPKDPQADGNDAFSHSLADIFGDSLFTLQIDVLGYIFWRVPLTLSQKLWYQQEPLVLEVTEDAASAFSITDGPDETTGAPNPDTSGVPHLEDSDISEDDGLRRRQARSARTKSRSRFEKRAGPGITTESNAGWARAMLSQPPGQSQLSKDYSYEESAGRGATVYIIDSGLDTDTDSYKNRKGKVRRILIPAPKLAAQQEKDIGRDSLNGTPRPYSWADIKANPQWGFQKAPDIRGHGTSMYSIATGGVHGAAQNADTVIVRFPIAQYDDGTRELFAISTMMSGMAGVMKDILANGLQGKAVVNCSWGWDKFIPDGVLKAWRLIIEGLIEKAGATIVTAAGNSIESQQVYDYPALFGGASNNLPGLIVVGSVNEDGLESYFTGFGDHVTAWAPGGGIPSESLTKVDDTCSGTSCATALVSGLIAYLLTSSSYGPYIAEGNHDGNDDLDKFAYTGPNVQKTLDRLARKISSDDKAPKVVYNGIAGDPPSGGAANPPSPPPASSSSSIPQASLAPPLANPPPSNPPPASPPAAPSDPNAGCSKSCLDKVKTCNINGKVNHACLTVVCNENCQKGCGQCS